MKKLLKSVLCAAGMSVLLMAASALTASADEPDDTPAVTTAAAVTTEAPAVTTKPASTTKPSSTTKTTNPSAAATTAKTTKVTKATTAGTTVTTVSTEESTTEATEAAETSATTETTETSETTATTAVTSETTVTTETTKKPSVTVPEISDDVQEGWNSIDGKWYYYDGKKFLKGMQEIDGEYYLFAYNGSLKTGWQTIKDLRRFYDSETHSPVYGWVEYLGNKYFNDREKGKISGMQKIGEKIYIFSKGGILQTGFVKYGGFVYLCDENKGVIYGDDKKTPVLYEDEYYLINPKGHVCCGWQTVNGKRKFYDYDTGECVYGWVSDCGNVYYVDKKYGKVTGDRLISSHKYRFTEKGVFCPGMQFFGEEYGDGEYFYFFEDGRYAAEEFVTDDGNTYYFDADGYMLKGWNDIGDETYYFNSDGTMKTGFMTAGSKTYYFDIHGRMQKGLVNAEKDKYFFNSEGVMQYGFQRVKPNTYYFDPDTGKAFVGWHTISGKTYYFSKSGIMAVDFADVDGETYYFGSEGYMRTGWMTIGTKKYYLGDDGKVRKYRHEISGKNYLFYSDGSMATTGCQPIVLKAISQLGQEGGKPYWTWWGSTWRFEWCACFVSWCANQCGYTANKNCIEFISCKVGIEWFKEHNQWKGKNYTPKSGDFVFFDWEPDGIADHVGIVDYCENGYLYTVEGNSDDMVRRKVYDLKSENIFGFAAPNFPQDKY